MGLARGGRTAVGVACLSAATFLAGVGRVCAGSTAPRPSLLLITIDTVRTDHLSAYGYRRETSPRLSQLAHRGVAFQDAISPIPQTGPAHAALLTGRCLSHLGQHANGQPLDPRPTTLAEVLSSAGYETAGFVSGFPLVGRISGLARGFSHFDDQMPDPRGSVPAVQRRGSKTTDAALAWLDRRTTEGATPFFLWVHYYEPHGDYAPGGEYETLFVGGPSGLLLDVTWLPRYQRRGSSLDAAEYVARYDGELRYVDDQIGRLLDGLGKRGVLDTTLVVATGDHGENLVEHGCYFDHGNEVYIEAVSVPFILAGPRVPQKRARVEGVAPLVDVMPTVLELLEVPVPPGLEGLSLVAALASKRTAPPRECVSEARLIPAGALTPISDVTPKLSVRDKRFALLWRIAAGTVELYDRRDDPREERDLFAPVPQDTEVVKLRAMLLARLAGHRDLGARSGTEISPVISPELRARLERWVAGRSR